MKILALLQCVWVKPTSLASIQRTYARHGSTPDGRANVNRVLLFYKSKSGRRLREAFGDLCERIVWEETTKEIATTSSGCFKIDTDHVRAVMEHFKPDVILTFGKVAEKAANEHWRGVRWIHTCHPAARGGDVVSQLNRAAHELRTHLQSRGQ